MSEQKPLPQIETIFPGLYIHIPFCRSKCPYCDFYSIASSTLIPRWLESLKKEMSLYRDKFSSFDTVYIGGGTPSFLDISTIYKILGLIEENYKVIEGAEITIEANPGDLSSEKIYGIKGSGINRINLGVQSFNDDELFFLGRLHRAVDSRKVLNALGKAGFDNIGIDLIYGLKDQSFKDWLKTLERAVSFDPEHISCYQLTIEGKTVFNAMKNKGELEEFPEDTASRFFLETSDFLEQQGYIHYEVSNFAKSPELRSRHNRKYWQRIPYLGLGPSVHSFDGKKRWWNYRSVKKYCTSLECGKQPVEDSEVLTEEQEVLEKVYLGLRTVEGIIVDDLADLPGIDERLASLESTGHVRKTGNRIIPTKKGLLVADRLPLYIIDQDSL
ncbi:MAG: radical SAM family heme chaperone HemW [Desulfobacteraceae bacterium]|jgi:oxygen-independent coproporphyrinogen-3 oxidase